MKRFWSSIAVVVMAALAGALVARAQTPTPSPAPAAATQPPNGLQRIAFIDVQRVLARSAAGVAAREALERDKATMQKEMDTKRVELEKLREELEKKGALLTADARRDKQEQFERKRRDAARLADDFQKELEKKESTLLQKVLQEVSGIIERIGKEKGYYLIVEKRGGGVIYAAADADLTEEIIRAYDRESGPRAPVPAPAAAPAKKP
jgi:outer membrane protein